MVDVKALREAMSKATKRPWEVSVLSDVPRDDSIGIIGPDGADVVTHGGLWPSITDDADAALIVAAVNALPELLDDLDETRAVRDRWRADFEEKSRSYAAVYEEAQNLKTALRLAEDETAKRMIQWLAALEPDGMIDGKTVLQRLERGDWRTQPAG